MKRQQQDGAGIVAVEPGTLALGGAKGEELLEELLVDDDAADQRDEHRHGGEPHQPHAQRTRHVQGEVEAEEEVAADRLSWLERFAADRVDRGAATAPLLTGRYGQRRRTLGGQAYVPRLGLGVAGLQPLLRRIGRQARVDGAARQLRLHPAIEFLVEHRQRAGQEDGEEHPAEQQPAPGMQPGHRLGECPAFHPRRSSSCGQKPIRARPSVPVAVTRASRRRLTPAKLHSRYAR